MSIVVATINHVRGESISWGLRATPAFTGAETIYCRVKEALNGNAVPSVASPVLCTATPTFVPAEGNTDAHWLFSLTPAQSAALKPGKYVTDAKITDIRGGVIYPKPLGIILDERVSA